MRNALAPLVSPQDLQLLGGPALDAGQEDSDEQEEGEEQSQAGQEQAGRKQAFQQPRKLHHQILQQKQQEALSTGQAPVLTVQGCERLIIGGHKVLLLQLIRLE